MLEWAEKEKDDKDILYGEECYKVVGFCMEVHRELGNGHDEIIYKDALQIELGRNSVGFVREQGFQITYKGVILPHKYFADFVAMDKILLEVKAVDAFHDAHTKQVLNYLAASKLKLGLLVNFGETSLKYKRILLG